MKRRGRTGVAIAVAAALVLALLAAGLAQGERTQQGDLVVSLDGGISPLELPRHQPAPASLDLSGALYTVDGTPLPRLHQVELAIAARGGIDTRGLPICPKHRLEAATVAGALAACGDALVGHGILDVEVFIHGQEPFEFKASLRAFNGRFRDGARAVWLHIYGPRPPSSFVLDFAVRHRRGSFPTVLVATLPPTLGPLPHLARFEMTFGRRFAYRGQRRSFLNADCPLPRRFTAGLFPFARATYAFPRGHKLSTTIVRGCRARGGRGR
jgi:hypothetical protein